jgi:hypothetical protein
MSEPTGRPSEPETTLLPTTQPITQPVPQPATQPVPPPGAQPGAEGAPQWAVASTGQTQPVNRGAEQGTAPFSAQAPDCTAAGSPAPAVVGAPSGAPEGAPAGAPAGGHDGWHSGPAAGGYPAGGYPGGYPGGGYPGGTLPPQTDGWGPQGDVLANGPQGGSRRRFPLGLAAAGGAVLIAGAAFAAGMAISGHDARVQNTAVGSPLGNGQGQQAPGQQGQGQQGQGQQGQGGGQLGNPPNGGRLPSGIGRLVAAGTIASIDGGTLVVQGQNAQQVTVKTSADTQVEQDLGGTVDSLRVGDLIFVAGRVGSDGTVTALAIADRPFFAGIPGNQNGTGQNGTGQNGTDDGTGQNGTDDGQNTFDQAPGQADGGVTT